MVSAGSDDIPIAIFGARSRNGLYEQLRDTILSGDFPPGMVLVETILAENFKVSRTPIREALLRLEQDGLVARDGRELTVRERSQEEILDIYEVRILLESVVARSAATRRGSLDIDRLRKVAQSLKSVNRDEPDQMMLANRFFHQTLWKAGHNEALADLLTRLDLHLSRYPATTLSMPGRWEESLEEHEALIDAIEAQDAEKASELARLHFTKAREIRLDLWSQSTV